jgi:hypothetical protein
MADYFCKDHQPLASQGEARVRGLYRSNCSKTISPRPGKAKPACAGYGGLCLQRPLALGYARRSPRARAMADYVCKDHQPSAMRGEARLRGLCWIYSVCHGVRASSQGQVFWKLCAPSPVSGIKTPNSPFSTLWEKGVGGMKGKSAPECRKSLISPRKSTAVASLTIDLACAGIRFRQ